MSREVANVPCPANHSSRTWAPGCLRLRHAQPRRVAYAGELEPANYQRQRPQSGTDDVPAVEPVTILADREIAVGRPMSWRGNVNQGRQ